jgi:protein subunit release factor A
VTDHRINLSLHRLDEVMDGAINDLIEALQRRARKERSDVVTAS